MISNKEIGEAIATFLDRTDGVEHGGAMRPRLGQLFEDIRAFHEKFGLEPTTDPGHRLPDDLLRFRITCLLEEVAEYAEAVGLPLEPGKAVNDPGEFDAIDAFDALIDLAYFALGTAYLHRFPFDEGWARVQAANMAKVRAKHEGESKRGSAYDVVKPEGWQPAELGDLL